MRAGAMTIEPDALAYLDVLYGRASLLAGRVDHFLDLLEEDPHAPEVHNRAHVLKDSNGENFSGVSVRTATDDAMILWRTESTGDQVVVRIIYIGDNALRL